MTRGGHMTKRGQAAMEFLMTYGWALLVVLVAIGALAFFGVLNPSKFLPNSCTLAPGFSCTDFLASGGSDTITVRIQNGLGDSLGTVSLWLASSEPAGTGCDGQFTVPADGSTVSLIDGAAKTFVRTCVGGTGLSAGNKLKSDLRIAYTSSSSIPHIKIGQLVTGVEA